MKRSPARPRREPARARARPWHFFVACVALAVLGLWWWPTDGAGPAVAPDTHGKERQDQGELARRTRREHSDPLPEPVIVGRVADQAGQPLSQASVCASARAVGAARPLSAYCVTSANDGSYQIAALTTGQYRLVAAAQGHRPSDARDHPELIAIPTAEAPLRRDFVLLAGGASVAGVVHDRAGGPIPGARVEALGLHGQVAPVVSVLTDDHGTFVLTTDEGPLTLRVSAEGYAETTYATVAPSSALRVELGVASRLAGKVVSETDEEPLGEIVVTATQIGSLSFASVVSATTDDAGRFVIDGLSAGTYQIEARGASSHGRLSKPVTVGVGESQDNLRLVLDFGVTVTGRVLIGVAKRPCPGAQLGLTGAGFRAESVADAAGAFRFEAVAAGSLDLDVSCATAAPAAPGARRLEIGAHDLTDLELLLAEALSLRGRVVDDRGQGVGEQNVTAVALAPNAMGGMATSAARGEFELTGLAPGSYRIMLDQSPEVNRTVTVTPGGRAQDVVLVLPPSGGVRVQLRASSGALDDDWVVHARAGQAQRFAAKRGAGVYELSHLAEGRYEVYAYDPNGASVSGECEVHTHQTTELTLQVPDRSGQITGIVSDERGAPVADARVRAVARGGAPLGPNGARFVLSERDGSFSLDGLAQRTSYDLEAESTFDGAGRLLDVAVGRHVKLVLSGPGAAPPVVIPTGVLTAGASPLSRGAPATNAGPSAPSPKPTGAASGRP